MTDLKPSSMRRSASPEEAPKKPEDAPPPALAPECRGCGSTAIKEEDFFCGRCGTPLAARVVISLSDEEIRDFLFTGHISRNFKLFEDVLGEDCFRVEVRTIQDKDNREIAQYMSRYTSEQGGVSKVLGDDFMGEKRIQQLARAVVSINGVKLESAEAGVQELQKHSESVISLLQDHYNALARAVEAALKSERRVKKP